MQSADEAIAVNRVAGVRLESQTPPCPPFHGNERIADRTYALSRGSATVFRRDPRGFDSSPCAGSPAYRPGSDARSHPVSTGVPTKATFPLVRRLKRTSAATRSDDASFAARSHPAGGTGIRFVIPQSLSFGEGIHLRSLVNVKNNLVVGAPVVSSVSGRARRPRANEIV